MKTQTTGGRLAVVVLITVLLASTAGVAVAFAQDGAEPNDDRGNATSVAPGQRVDAELASDDVDWYGVDDVQRGRSVEATLSVDENASDGMYVLLFDSSGDPVSGVATHVEPGETATAGAITERSGTYYVEVFPEDDATGGYSLEVSTAETDEFEPNQEPDAATTVQPDQQVTGELTSNDHEWFAFGDVHRGRSIEVRFSVDANASGGMLVSLYGPGLYGDYIPEASTYVGPGETVTTGAVAEGSSGSHYALVEPYFDATGSYSFEVSTAETDEFEPNQNLESSTPLDPDESVSGELSVNDREWFAVRDVTAKSTLNATLSVDANASDGMYVTIYDPSGDPVSGDPTYVAPGETGTGSAVVERSGAYYVQVSPPPYGATGRYRLNTTTGGPC